MAVYSALPLMTVSFWLIYVLLLKCTCLNHTEDFKAPRLQKRTKDQIPAMMTYKESLFLHLPFVMIFFSYFSVQCITWTQSSVSIGVCIFCYTIYLNIAVFHWGRDPIKNVQRRPWDFQQRFPILQRISIHICTLTPPSGCLVWLLQSSSDGWGPW